MREYKLANGVTRREFLKTTAATAAVVAVGDRLFGGPVSSLVKNAEAASTATEDVWVKTSCYMCRRDCGVWAHRVNGVIVNLEGDADNPVNRGKLCARAHGLIGKVYNLYAVKSPMKRTNPEKGRVWNEAKRKWESIDPKWVEISWDEALDTVAKKLKEIKADNPNKLIVMSGHGIKGEAGQIARAFGTASTPSGSGGMTCAAAMHMISYLVNGTSLHIYLDNDEVAWKHVNYLIVIGHNPSVGKAAVPETRLYTEARARGMKLVVIDPRLGEEAAKADEWLCIRPGTDSALFLGMSHVLLHELNVYDAWSLKNRSNGPYLIDSNGWYVRSKTETYEDKLRKESFGKPLVWDPVEGKAKTFDDKTIKDFALEGTYTVDGVTCRPAFQVIKDHLKQYTPEWAEKITTIPAGTMRRIAREWAEAAQIGSTIEIDGQEFPYRPVAVSTCRGGQTHKHGFHQVMAYHLFGMLVGNVEVPGGNARSDAVLKPGPDGVQDPQGIARYRFKFPPPDARMMDTFWPINYKTYWATWMGIVEPEKFHFPFKPEMLINLGAGPLHTMGSTDIGLEAFKKIPLVVTMAWHYDEQAEMSDILLPEPGTTGWFTMAGNTLRQPMLDKPMYNTRLPEDIFTEVADRAGFLDKWNGRMNTLIDDALKLDTKKRYQWVDIFDRILKTDFGPDHGLTWFQENGFYKAPPTPEKEMYGYLKGAKSRIPIYFEYVKWAGERLKKDLKGAGVNPTDVDWLCQFDEYQPLPEYKPLPTHEAPAEFDLYAVNYKTPTFGMYSMDNPYLMELTNRYDPYTMNAWINAATAKTKGLKDGDLVWVESYIGTKVPAEIKVSECIHPEVVAIGGAFGRWSRHMNPASTEGPHWNTLVSYEMKYVEPIAGGFEMNAKVKLHKV